MAIIEEQLVDSSRKIADMVVAYIGDDEKLFNEAVKLMLLDKYPVSMRAGRIVYLVSNKYPQLIRPYIHSLIKYLGNANVDGVKRSILAVLNETRIKISEDDLGILTEHCFNYVLNSNEAVAIRAISIDILVKIIKIYPELKYEFFSVIDTIIPEIPDSLKRKCKKIIKELNNV